MLPMNNDRFRVQASKIGRCVRLLKRLSDVVLLFGFITQTFVAGCLLFNGYLPLPANRMNSLINDPSLKEEIRVQAAAYRLRANGALHVVDLKVGIPDIHETLFEAELATLELTWPNGLKRPRAKTLCISEGTLFIPSVHSPDGRRTELLERIALRLQLDENNVRIERFAARHDSIRIHGVIDFPAISKDRGQQTSKDALHRFYTQTTHLLREKARIRYLKTPVIFFHSKLSEKDPSEFLLRVNSSQLNHPEVHAEQILLKTHLNWDGGRFSCIRAPLLTASSFRIPRYKITGESIRAQALLKSISELSEGRWPEIQLSADSFMIAEFELDAPILRIDSSERPLLQFNGATGFSNGVVHLNGMVNAEHASGTVRARGHLDWVKLIGKRLPDWLPKVHFEEVPYLDLNLNFNEKFSLNHAELQTDATQLMIGNLRLDHFHANARLENGFYSIDHLDLSHRNQWLHLQSGIDSKTHDYQITLTGSALSDDYTSILPDRLKGVFHDFEFSQNTRSHADFVISGNTQRMFPDRYFGHVKADKIAYQGLFLDEVELTVRGGGPYVELYQLRARRGPAWARGDIRFRLKSNETKESPSTRFNLEANHLLEDAKVVTGDTVHSILSRFETEALLSTRLQGTIFHGSDTSDQTKSFFNLSLKSDRPVYYKKMPFDYMNFDLYSRSHVISLRNLHFGYAKGTGQGAIDVLLPPKSETSVRYRLKLAEANSTQALQNLPQPGNPGGPLGVDDADRSFDDALLDLDIHGEGAIGHLSKHRGFGRLQLRSQKLGSIQLLGPLSKFLQTLQLDFTSFNLNHLKGDFEYSNQLIDFEELEINGPLTGIRSRGTLDLEDQSLDMHVRVDLLKNANSPIIGLDRIKNLVIQPIVHLLELKLTGTIEQQRIHLLYNPVNFIF